MIPTIRILILIGWVIFYCTNGVVAAESDDHNNQAIYNQWSWEKNQSGMEGLISIGSSGNQSSDDGLKEYRHSKDEYSFDGIKLKEIRYTFWKNRLYAIGLRIKGKKDFSNLKNKIANRFNNSNKTNMTNDQFIWNGANTITRSSYNEKTGVGQIELLSYSLNQKRQLIKFLPSSVYSSWIKQKQRLKR